MIVKFRNNTGITEGETWEVIADVKSYRYGNITKEEYQEGGFMVNEYITKYDEFGRIDEHAKGHIYVQLWTKRKEDDPIVLVSNMDIYILNDEGKTIDKIN